ncbi:hypothetical protein GCM10010512_18700 [Streptomyces thermoviolaceus subsp. thermoviolaceus]|nr:hypothetical protein GCM10010512_18700 [Streptomyces thermoviolaceus subsp. thermoviolaceus]
MAGRRQQRRREFGTVRKLASGRWQARYVGPDGTRHKAPETFDTKTDAQDPSAWIWPPAPRASGWRGPSAISRPCPAARRARVQDG